MANVQQNIGIKGEKIKAENELSTEMPKEATPLSPSQTRESYWFAHGGAENSAATAQSDSKHAGGDSKEEHHREEKMRLFREQQEEERRKRLRDLEQQFQQAKRHREQQEEERRRRIDEARVKESERRQQVEERKRQIWEAEQERKEAILRRNMEREARIEARRNAQRNSQCFAFGSSTPRTFDLDLAAIGVGRNSVLMSSVSRKSEERELGPPPRATSACSLDRKFGEDCMSRSMVSLSSSTSSAFRGRKRTDITPTLSRERSVTPHVRGNTPCMRAVSMTRLDQLAQPRRPILAPLTTTTTTNNNNGPRTTSPSMSKSMFNIAGASSSGGGARRLPNPFTSRPPSSARSMLHLADSAPKAGPTSSPIHPGAGMMRPAQSMLHLAPRLTRTAQLRALAAGRAKSAWNVNKEENNTLSPSYASGKDASRSPSRPQSSMSGTSDISATSSSASVSLRRRPAPRPRPYSVHGSLADTERPARLHERNVSAPKPSRAKSATRENTSAPLKKPVPPPKPSDIASKSHSVPTKDNLRKVGKSVSNPVSIKDSSKTLTETKTKPVKIQNPVDKIECKRKEEIPQSISDAPPPVKPDSSVISPTSDSEFSISGLVLTSDADSTQEVDPTSESMSSQAAPSMSVSAAGESSHLDPQRDNAVATPAVVAEPASIETIKNEVVAAQSSETGAEGAPKPRITSEEEARTALAEKRRLAREQAEREAEQERLRQEEIKRQEEERCRLEEEEQRRMEEEQIRLAELHRKLEEEKLAKAIEEQKLREKEEEERREEETRARAEKEEQERKAREEAERQRLELEEKLKKEEEERAERKKRVEQIMARTRGKSAAASPSTPSGENKFKGTDLDSSADLSRSCIVTNGSSSSSPAVDMAASWCAPTSSSSPLNNGLLPNQQSVTTTDLTERRTLSANEAAEANGYSSQEEMSCTTSPEENVDSGLLIDIRSCQQQQQITTTTTSSSISSVELSSKLLVDVSPLDNNTVHNNDTNYLINIDNVNSNLFNSGGNAFTTGFDSSLQQMKQDTSSTVTDLLS